MVHSACYRVHVFVVSAWLCIHTCRGRIVHTFAECSAGCGYPYIYRYGLSDFRYAFGNALGKAGLGTLLGLGSEGDLGPGDVAGLCALYPFEVYGQGIARNFVFFAYIWIRMSADVLVGHKLPACSSR